MKLWGSKKSYKLTEKQKIGNIGEDLAVKYLKNNGFKIIDRNYRQKWGEIDVISQKEAILHFIEVKTVTIKGKLYDSYETANDNYEPEDNIHPWKLKRLSRVIETYLLEKNIDEDADWQLDAISIYLNEDGGLIKLEYLEEIF